MIKNNLRTAMTGPQVVGLISRSSRMPLRDDDAAMLAGMIPFCFESSGRRAAWLIGDGPLVVLVHGWGGLGAQMAPLAVSLAGKGFRCVLFDAGGHGQSADAAIGFDTFISDVDAIVRHMGEDVYALVGHSAGGLGMMAARSLHDVRARQYVCITTPFFPYVPLESLKAKYDLDDETIELAKPVLASQFATSWSKLEAGAAFWPQADSLLTLVYDHSDLRVRNSDADRIAVLWPGAEIFKTDSLGHNRILKDPGVIDHIASKLTDA